MDIGAIESHTYMILELSERIQSKIILEPSCKQGNRISDSIGRYHSLQDDALFSVITNRSRSTPPSITSTYTTAIIATRLGQEATISLNGNINPSHALNETNDDENQTTTTCEKESCTTRSATA